MKKLFILSFLFCSLLGFSQNAKADYSKLPIVNIVRVNIEGVDLQNKIWQDSIVKLTELKLAGIDSENFEIVFYRFKTNYKKSLSVDEFTDAQIPPAMTQFFKDLEKNCKISFEDVVVKQKENGKLFKIFPLTIIIKV